MNFRKLTPSSRHSGKLIGRQLAHMTWTTNSLGRTVNRAGMVLKKQLWIWPIIAVVLLSVIGVSVRAAIEATMKENLRAGLQAILDMETAMLKTWLEIQRSNAQTLANDLQIREHIYQLLDEMETAGDDDSPLVQPPIAGQLSKELGPGMTSHDYVGFFVADRNTRIIAASSSMLVGQKEVKAYSDFLSRALDGETTVSKPFPSVAMMEDEFGEVRVGVPTMYVCAPVRDNTFQVVAAIAFQIRPEGEFTRILQLGQVGDTGESYAFDKEGLMVSNSRFDEELILLGLIPDKKDSRSILNLLVRDPGGNMTEGYRPNVRRSKLPLTRMAESAISGSSGIDVDGYRDFRGVRVVGAWTWLPDYEMGVATEVDAEQAFRPLIILQRTFWGLYALLGISSIAIFVFTLVVARLRREAQKAAIAAQQLGQYKLEKRLGSGGMGVVYKGYHAMMRRPTAIKLLDVEKVNDASIQRFEREVQITCQLNHPNTVAIYDYGRTPEGVFYYAMEFLDGIDLQNLVDEYGPQPEARAIHILLQVCGSLYEAHTHGVVHRDIKPANIMLNRRGAEPDVAKVLDFGLVKAINDEQQSKLTSANSLTGTPMYMSPEAIQNPEHVDARSDLYALGAVAYFLVTGKPVFVAESIVDLCQKHVSEAPEPPSQRLGRPICPDLEAAIMACLEKSRSKRPQTARDLAQLIKKSPLANAWSLDEADAWWRRHERGLATGSSSATRTAPAVSAPAVAAPEAVERTMITNNPEE